MKVTVCFGTVRVVVPCRQENMLVRDLMQQATMRYKKATSKPSSTWVLVRSLQSEAGGGILDPDDCLEDVVDDRENIIAVYDEDLPNVLRVQGNKQDASDDGHPGGAGDGTSTSSVGTASPDFFLGNNNRTAIEVTGGEASGGTVGSLQVRRGSEPVLNQVSLSPEPQAHPAKRWSAATSGREDNDQESSDMPLLNVVHRRSESQPATQRLGRDSHRLSMQFTGDGGASIQRWVDSAERTVRLAERRKEPLGASGATSPEDRWEEIVIVHSAGPLGIHVVPAEDLKGMLVQGVEEGGCAQKQGGLNAGDILTHINGRALGGVSFHRAQEIFRDALNSQELRVGVVKSSGPATGQVQQQCHNNSSETHVNGEKKESVNGQQTTVLGANSLIVANTRKIGQKMEIELLKGPHGLGFSVTTRDNPAGGHCPIYIKNVLPKGAAIEDGRLRPGDRLLQVNGVDLEGKGQSDAVALLRATPLGGTVKLVLSRQQNRPVSPQMPRALPPEKANDDGQPIPWQQREIIDLKIPVNDTETAGLGVSVKGKTATSLTGCSDLGIFVKSVLNGGAASRDGRLRSNDQLIRINGVSLMGLPNAAAMEALRRAMQRDGPSHGMIELTVARRNAALSSVHDGCISITHLNGSLESCGRSDGEADTSATSETSEGTAIFLPTRKIVPTTLEHNLSPKPDRKPFSSLNPPVNRNPVVDRLMGQKPFHNESYYRATHDTWNATFLQQHLAQPDGKSNPVDRSPTVGPLTKEIIQIEEDQKCNQSQDRIYTPRSPNPPAASVEVPRSDATYNSHSDLDNHYRTSLEEEAAGFSRDAFGRQSMSEKRHATLDARNTDTYQRNKRLREERQRQMQQGADHGQDDNGGSGNLPRAASMESLLDLTRLPQQDHNIQNERHTIGTRSSRHPGSSVVPSWQSSMKKSTSLESLHRIHGQEQHLDEPGSRAPVTGRQTKVIRGRGCNESFRAAVDRSYEAGDVAMDPGEEDMMGAYYIHGDHIPSSGAATKSTQGKKGKKKSGILKGLGQVFRFGRPRKELDVQPRLTEELLKQQQAEFEREATIHHIDSHGRRSERITGRGRSPGVPPNYVNYDQLQMHMRHRYQGDHVNGFMSTVYRGECISPESRWQQQYHSQRCAPPKGLSERPTRPTSTFFEYESIQGMLRGGTSLPRHMHRSRHPHHLQDSALPMRFQVSDVTAGSKV